jgi:SAM-dependent methyltransferase
MTTIAGFNVPGVSRRIEGLDTDALRTAVLEEYSLVASEPEHGFHFHTGKRLGRILGYSDEWLDRLPTEAVASFAGTGNPLSAGEPAPGERVVDVGCGAGIDSLIAATLVGEKGAVIGVDMTPAMVERARSAAGRAGLANVTFRQGVAEDLPVESGWADLVISNGVLNLFPDKLAGLEEMARVLEPGGRLQIGDILVQRSVGDKAKRDISLWKG